ncbi:MAG TPA: hypothetical protein VJ774_00840 [Actinomycetota bacterium]|nr:hypothetical protein [Actinomycetota bacterium]
MKASLTGSIIGNAAEHSAAMLFALRNKVDITLEIAIGSSTQIALFVAPALVFISLLVGHPMDFRLQYVRGGRRGPVDGPRLQISADG